MRLSFRPFTYFYLRVYSCLIVSLFMVSNIFFFWLIIEFLLLLLMGVSYSILAGRFSSLILFFLIQAFSSMGLLVFYLLNFPLLFTAFFLFKLSMFPFHFWVLSVSYRMPNLLLFLTSTLNKLPVFLIIFTFDLNLYSPLLWLSIVLSLFISGSSMIWTSDLRLLVISSSIGNNSWFSLCCLYSFRVFFIFFSFYCLLLLFLFVSLKSLMNLSLNFTNRFRLINCLLLFMSGLPPFPMFFLKIFVLFLVFRLIMFSYPLLLFILMSSLIVMGYVNYMFKVFIYQIRTPSLLTLSL